MARKIPAWDYRKKRQEEEVKKATEQFIPTPEPVSKTPAPIEQPKITEPQVRRNEKGKVVGVIMPDGREITASPSEVKGLIANYTAKTATPTGAVERADIIAQQQKIEEANRLAAQIGQVGGITSERYAELIKDITPEAQFREGLPGALREGTTQAVSKGLTYGATAGAAGLVAGTTAPVTVPVAAALGATAGVISGYWSALRGQTKAEAKEDVDNLMAEFTQLKKAASNVATMTTSSQMNPDEAVELFNAQYSRMIEVQASLKYLTDSDLKDYMGDGGGDLITVTTYLNRLIPAYQARVQTGLTNPNAATIPYSDVFTEDLEEAAV